LYSLISCQRVTEKKAAREGEMLMRGIRQTVEGATRFLHEEDGPSAVEYAVMLALIVMACAGTVQYIGQRAWWVSNVIIDAVDDAG